MEKNLSYSLRFLIFCIILAVFCILFCVAAKLYFPEYNTASAEMRKEPAPVLILDAGHGGIDGGCVGKSGTLEKNVNLDIALIMSDFCRLLEIDADLTRNDDVSLADVGAKKQKQSDLYNRVRVAEKYPDAVFLSIHMNSFPYAACRGLQTFYSKNNESSKPLAEKIQTLASEWLDPQNNRKTKAAGTEIYILDRIENPCVLIECGFLSDDKEEKLLTQKDYQKKIGFCILSAAL